MSTLSERLPVAPVNLVAVVLAFIAAVVSVLNGNVWGGVVLVVAGGYTYLAARWARRDTASDLTRINALEYRDERDRTLARDGLAVVGVAALILCFIEFIVAIALGEPLFLLLVAAQAFVITVVWLVANVRAVRRG